MSIFEGLKCTGHKSIKWGANAPSPNGGPYYLKATLTDDDRRTTGLVNSESCSSPHDYE